MQKKKPTHRAWNLIRLAFLWARKRRVFRRKLVTELRLFPKFLKSIPFKHPKYPKALIYGEQQFSFEASPIHNSRKLSSSSIRFIIPCIRRSRVEFDYDFDFEYDFVRVDNDGVEARKSFLKDETEHGVKDDNDEDECDFFQETSNYFEDDVEDEEEIDAKAEHFISHFYEQMKLQRQLSYARRGGMLHRGIC